MKKTFEDLSKKAQANAIDNHTHMSSEAWAKHYPNKQLADFLGVDLNELRRIIHARVQPVYGISWAIKCTF